MWCPAAAGLITRLLFQGTLRGVGWRISSWKYISAGYWLPLAYAAPVYFPVWAAGFGNFHTNVIKELLASVNLGSLKVGAGIGLLVYVLVNATIGIVTSCVTALGEELGWRGFLVPELAKTTSFGWVAFASGVIWGAWHLPLIIGADYHGSNPLWYSLACFGVTVIAMGYLYAWIRLESGSVWPAMLLHGSHNQFVQSVFDPLTRHTPFTDYATGEFGAGLSVAAVIVALIVWRKCLQHGANRPVS
jgi:membrane protease YdiL (CAAX protease family)